MVSSRNPSLATLAATLALAGGPVLAQAQARAPAFPPFPATRGAAAIADWTTRYTDVPLGQVVAVGADSLFALDPASSQAAAPAMRVLVRQEAIAPDFARRLGGRSAVMSADIDCAAHRVFQRGVQLYVGSNRQGSARALPPAADWQPIPAGTYMERVMVAACDPDWRSPFIASLQAAAPAAAPPPRYTSPPYQAPPAPAPAPGGDRVEIGRFASVDAALAAWRELASALPAAAGRPVRIEITGGQYRALLDGFAGPGEADAFCGAVLRAGKPCLRTQ